jgi:hypothetical protein
VFVVKPDGSALWDPGVLVRACAERVARELGVLAGIVDADGRVREIDEVLSTTSRTTRRASEFFGVIRPVRDDVSRGG